jgi:hypothetical protein
MYINSEKDLEDYICENIKEFINFLKDLYKYDDINVEKIEFVGRQIVVGDSRFDLLFEIQEKTDDQFVKVSKTYIVVELKFRKAEPKDIAQLSRYLNLLNSLECDERVGTTLINARGILLTTGLNSEMQDIQMYLNDYTNADIKFVHIDTKINFEQDGYYYKNEFLKNMTVDSRLKKIKQEVIECGEEKNDRS